jgi:hypothetical protein
MYSTLDVIQGKKLMGADTRNMPLMRLLEKMLSSFLCGFENFLKSWWW